MSQQTSGSKLKCSTKRKQSIHCKFRSQSTSNSTIHLRSHSVTNKRWKTTGIIDKGKSNSSKRSFHKSAKSCSSEKLAQKDLHSKSHSNHTIQKIIRYFEVPNIHYRNKYELVRDFGYSIGKKLGEGSFGKVFLANDDRNGSLVACKWMDLGNIKNNELMQDTANELKIMLDVRHPHVVKVFCYFIVHAEDKNQMYMFMEYADGGDLYEHLKKRGKLIDELLGRMYFAQILVGMHHLHNYGIAHRDMKLTNVLLKRNEKPIIMDHSNDFRLLLADFGLSAKAKTSSGKKKLHQTSCGTPAYMAPEIWQEKLYDALKVDIWALGVSLHEMFTLQNPFDPDGNLEEKYLRFNIINGIWKWSDRMKPSTELEDLVKSMLTLDGTKRINLSLVTAHTWIREAYVEAHTRSDKLKEDEYREIENNHNK